MKRTKALLFLTLALCAALLTGCRSNVPNTTDGRLDGTEPSALIPTAASKIMTEPSAATDDSRTESESGILLIHTASPFGWSRLSPYFSSSSRVCARSSSSARV